MLVQRLVYPEALPWRPRKREDCKNVPRPCPYVGCRHNNYLELAGSYSFNGKGIPDMLPVEDVPTIDTEVDIDELVDELAGDASSSWLTELRSLGSSSDENGRPTRLSRMDCEPWDVDPRISCSLDLADEGTHTLEEVGAIFAVTRERIRQVETKAAEAVRRRGAKRLLPALLDAIEAIEAAGPDAEIYCK